MTGKSITTIEAEFRSMADDDLEDHENWVKVMEIADKALFHELLHNTVRFKTELTVNAPLLIAVWKIWTRWSWRFFVSALTSFPGEWKALPRSD